MLYPDYYVCDYKTHKVLLGPWKCNRVVTWINASDEPKKYCNMSRYLLAKEGLYPYTKAGSAAIEQHLEEFRIANEPDGY